jgi:hypothetical protein
MHGGSAYRGGVDSTLGVARTFGCEAVRRPGDGTDRIGGELGGSGVRSGRRRKIERKGSEVGGWWLLRVLGCTGGEGKRRGVQGSALRGGENGEERGGPGRSGGQLGWPTSAPGRWAQAAPLPRKRGGQCGTIG